MGTWASKAANLPVQVRVEAYTKGIYATGRRVQLIIQSSRSKIHAQSHYKLAVIWKSSRQLKGSNKETPGHPQLLLLTQRACSGRRSDVSAWASNTQLAGCTRLRKRLARRGGRRTSALSHSSSQPPPWKSKALVTRPAAHNRCVSTTEGNRTTTGGTPQSKETTSPGRYSLILFLKMNSYTVINDFKEMNCRAWRSTSSLALHSSSKGDSELVCPQKNSPHISAKLWLFHEHLILLCLKSSGRYDALTRPAKAMNRPLDELGTRVTEVKPSQTPLHLKPLRYIQRHGTAGGPRSNTAHPLRPLW